MFGGFNLDKTYQFLIIALAFFLPLTVFGGNLIIVIICILWIISGEYKSKFNQIIKNKLMLASILFFCIHVFGLLWTDDLTWGLHIVHKMWYFIGLLPILYTLVKKEYIPYYLAAFLISILLTEVISFLIWFEVIEPFKNATLENPTPFMSHISFNPILAFSIYLVLHEVLINKKLSKVILFCYSFFSISMVISMFITGGRAGQVVFFAMIVILIFQVFNKQKVKAILTISIIVPLIFMTAYQSSYLFNQRVDEAISNVVMYSVNKDTSVGQRLSFIINSYDVIKLNPILGVGTGDFPAEYKKINQLNTPNLPDATNPHNMYILVLMQLGFLGLVSMLSIFYYQIKLSFNSTNRLLKDVGLALPLLFLVMMLSDSYLLGHYTSLLFVFFSSFLYKGFEKN